MTQKFTKKNLQKNVHERYQSLSEEGKGKKKDSMGVNDTKIYQKMKIKRLLSIEKTIWLLIYEN